MKLTFTMGFVVTCQCRLIYQCEWVFQGGFSYSNDINNRDNVVLKVQMVYKYPGISYKSSRSLEVII